MQQAFDLWGMLVSMVAMTDMTAGEKLTKMWSLVKDTTLLL